MSLRRLMRGLIRTTHRRFFLILVTVLTLSLLITHVFLKPNPTLTPGYPQLPNQPVVAVQPPKDGVFEERPPRPFSQTQKAAEERLLQNHSNFSQHSNETQRHSNMTELIPRNDRKHSPAQGLAAEPLVHQSLFNDTAKDLALSFPRLHDVQNGTVLEQAIRSLEVLSDNEAVWGQTSFFKPRPRLVTTFVPKVLIDSVPCSSRSPFLLVLIPSVDTNVHTRQAIRETWASPAYGATWPGDTRNFTSLVQVVFFIGKTDRTPPVLEEESRKFKDIVQVDFQESYRNLSLKTALSVEWSATYCLGASHTLKVDQDTFVNLPLLLDLLQYLSDRGLPRFVLGFHHLSHHPPVVRSGRWETPEHLYPFSTFPRYLYGRSYVLSSQAVREIRAVWRYMPVVPNENAYMTGILAKAAGVTRIHCDRFATEKEPSPLPDEQMASGQSVSCSGFKPFKKLYDMWEIVKKHTNR